MGDTVLPTGDEEEIAAGQGMGTGGEPGLRPEGVWGRPLHALGPRALSRAPLHAA
ncbi:hypothetical protein [Streptomyces sp. NPDC058335]|uniref:hypothetical protein n=1 Tax=Streptomyces sp. NPDC058335 TaxID=3346451 RepID=UPI003646B1DD